MACTSEMPLSGVQLERKALLNMKSLLWCLHERTQQYNLNLALHSLEHGLIHPDIADSHLGDNLQFLTETFDQADIGRLREVLGLMLESKASMDVGDKHFEIGHYIQAERAFGPIAADANGVICAITPQLRGLFLLEGQHLLESVFAPSDVRVVFGTYVM